MSHTSYIELSYTQVLIAALLIVVNGGISLALRLDMERQEVDVRAGARLQKVVTQCKCHDVLQEGTAGAYAPDQVIVQRVRRMGTRTSLQVGTMMVGRVARHARAPISQVPMMVSIHHRRRG